MMGMPCGMFLSGESTQSFELVEENDKFSIFVQHLARKGLPDQYRERLSVGQSGESRLLDEAAGLFSHLT
jgi:hypothetical protein